MSTTTTTSIPLDKIWNVAITSLLIVCMLVVGFFLIRSLWAVAKYRLREYFAASSSKKKKDDEEEEEEEEEEEYEEAPQKKKQRGRKQTRE